MSASSTSGAAYWKANIRLVTIHLIVWALVSYGFGIILRPVLSGIPIGGTDLGFWFAQQGPCSSSLRRSSSTPRR